MKEKETYEEDKNRISKLLWGLYCGFLVLSLVIIAKIVSIQFAWMPDQDPARIKHFVPTKKEQVIKPERGSIIDCNGRLLAISSPRYNINMDCLILKKEFADEKEQITRDTLERNWRAKAKALSRELPKVLQEEGKDADYYYNLIITNRESDTMPGRRNVLIAKNIDHETYLKIKKLPLFCEGPNKGGMLETILDSRQYPYGGLAARVIGDVKISRDDPGINRFIGIEGDFNHILQGKNGAQWVKETDRNGLILDPDSTEVAVEHGKDVRLTLDIDIQDIADRALRNRIIEDEKIESGCVVVMEVETGAVKAMVNLKRDRNNNFRETFNMAIGQPGEPGSVFKAATLMTLLEDGHVTLGTEIPTCHGKMSDMPKISQDSYITNWERRYSTDRISVLDGFKISSNYVFRRLVVDHYGDKPENFVNRLYDYKLHDAYEFDLTEKGAKSSIKSPSGNTWSRTDLASVAIGYVAMETPLNIAMFYNAIANNGKMMKPYIVSGFEENGRTVKTFKPEILNGSICSKATADTLTRALKMVTLEGTAAKLKNAKCEIAGKTGTAWMVLPKEQRGASTNPFKDADGRTKYQATFVGFFPADSPKYTAIVTVYTYPTSTPVYGSSTPAMTFKEIVDGLWSLDPAWGTVLSGTGGIPEMQAEYIDTRKGDKAPVPDVKGMGLKDALFAIENNGYRCSYEGIGHVVSQSPAAGAAASKGATVKLILK